MHSHCQDKSITYVLELKSKQTLTAADKQQGLVYKRHLDSGGGDAVNVLLINFTLQGKVQVTRV